MTPITPTQSSLLARTLGRLKDMHQTPTAFVLGLTLKANDCPLELQDIREWLVAHEHDQPEQDPIGKKFTQQYATEEEFLEAKGFTTKPTPESSTHQVPKSKSDAGVDEQEKKGAEKDMTTQNGNGQRTWLDDTEDMLDGDFVKFDDGDEKVLKVVRNPIAGPIEFTQPDGTKKSNEGLNIEVLVDENPKIKTWSVTSKSLMQQIKAICLKERLGPELAGSTLRVTASGTGMQRKYFVKLLARPQTPQAQAQPRLESIPVSEADREAAFRARQGAAPQQPAPQQADPGQQWLQGQMQGAAPVGAR